MTFLKMKKEAVLASDQLKLAEQILRCEIKLGRAMKSPFRKDEHPSFSVYYGQDGKLRWKDFADQGGDLFGLAVKAWGVDFSTALDRLFGMVNGDLRIPVSPLLLSQNHIRQATIRNTVIKVKKREWDDRDAAFWEQRYELPAAHVISSGIIPIAEANVKTEEKSYTLWDHGASSVRLMYGISVGAHWKIYRPSHPNPRFKYGPSNTTRDDVFGFKKLSESSETENRKTPLILCAGQKDATCASFHLGVNCVSFNSEVMIPMPSQMAFIMQNSSRIHILYDNDRTGREWTERIVQSYPFVKPLHCFWPEGTKDFADLVEGRHTDTINHLRSQLK